ncbi:GEM-like protein 4 [Vitis vinifera]|uniref:GEM-like protein 4 n=1 Tax=Vitis vinifera TaxID=29760 RepID=A0A438EUR5_VITVI|nr:GEM-like protein 4 [Vitis vinifera]
MKNQVAGQVIGIPISFPNENPSSSNPSLPLSHNEEDRMQNMMNQHGKKGDNIVHGIREHGNAVRLAPRIFETVKGKLSLGARILQQGGMKRIFKQLFGVTEGENLLKASQCYLSTTAGPIAGLLFLSTQRVAFCSERSSNSLLQMVSIPLRKIKRVDQSENMKNPSQKYMEVVTADDFEFWFMGFLNYQKAFNCLQEALMSQS